jgi:hypothetical protein
MGIGDFLENRTVGRRRVLRTGLDGLLVGTGVAALFACGGTEEDGDNYGEPDNGGSRKDGPGLDGDLRKEGEALTKIDPTIPTAREQSKYNANSMNVSQAVTDERGVVRLEYRTSTGSVSDTDMLVYVQDEDGNPLDNTWVEHFTSKDFDAFQVTMFKGRESTGEFTGRIGTFWDIRAKSDGVTEETETQNNGDGTETQHQNLAGVRTLNLSPFTYKHFESPEQKLAAQEFKHHARGSDNSPYIEVKDYGCITAAEAADRRQIGTHLLNAGQLIPGVGQIFTLVNTAFYGKKLLMDALDEWGIAEREDCAAFRQYLFKPRNTNVLSSLAFTDCLAEIPDNCVGERPGDVNPGNNYCDTDGTCQEAYLIVENGTGSGEAEEYKAMFDGQDLGETQNGKEQWNLSLDMNKDYRVRIIGAESEGEDERVCAITVGGARMTSLFDHSGRRIDTPDEGELYQFDLSNGISAAGRSTMLEDGKFGIELILEGLGPGKAAEFEIKAYDPNV